MHSFLNEKALIEPFITPQQLLHHVKTIFAKKKNRIKTYDYYGKASVQNLSLDLFFVSLFA